MSDGDDISTSWVQRSAADRRFDRIVLALYACVVTLVSVLHEPWKDETQSWRLALDSDGVAALIHNARYEGHPLLFHLLLQVLGHLSRSWWAAVALHVLIACAAAWMVLRYSPFTRLERTLVVAGYFPVYEYAVIVRPYSLTMLLAFAACVAWTARRRRPVVAFILLALLANTTVMGLAVAFAAGAAFVFDLVWRDDAPLRITRRQALVAASAIAALALIAIVVAIQVIPPRDAGFRGEGVVASNRSLWHFATAFTTPLRALTPIARIGDGTVQWNNWIFKPLTTAGLTLALACTIVIVALGCVATMRRRAALVLYLSGTLGLAAFFALVLIGYARHHGHLVLVWIMAMWLSRAGPPTVWPASMRSVADRANGAAPRIFVISLIPMMLAAAEFLAGDAAFEFSDARRVAAIMRDRGLDTIPLLGVSRSDAQAVAAFLERPVISPLDGTVGTFVVWGRTAPDQMPSPEQIAALTDTLLLHHCTLAMISTRQSDIPPSLMPRPRMVYESPVLPMSANWYRVWVQSAPPSPRCPPTAR